MKKYRTIIGLGLLAGIIYGIQYWYCNFQGYCCWTNHVERIQKVALPLHDRLEKYFAVHQQYPEWDEMGEILKNTECEDLKFHGRTITAFSLNDSKEVLVDNKGKTIKDYKYSCQLDSRELEIEVKEYTGNSEFTDWKKQTLKLKKLDDIKIRLLMGNTSSCRLVYDDNHDENVFCGKASCIEWSP